MKLKKASSALLVAMLLFGTGAVTAYFDPIAASRSKVVRPRKHLKRHFNRRKAVSNKWFTDGLSKPELQAREWVSWHESRDHWNVLSYGHVCIGRYQLSPSYLGKQNGRVNLNHQHQVKVADHYARTRYGGWANAKRFWQAHHWY